jgi:hypothetical protein
MQKLFNPSTVTEMGLIEEKKRGWKISRDSLLKMIKILHQQSTTTNVGMLYSTKFCR